MDKDLVCGMTVSRGEEAGKTEYQGKTYYFCSPRCKHQFDRNPQQYTIRRPADPIE
jgi:YHS domain-containing protein